MTSIANKSDFAPVSICFEEDSINQLFAELLESIGVKVQIVEKISNAPKETRIITEPQFFPDLTHDLRQHCLLVGNKGSLEGLNVPTLSRPLTAEKIHSALEQFLKA